MTETQQGPLASPPGHPNLDTLADYGAGVLDPAESTQLQAHVSSCARCQGVLAGSAAVPDLLRTLPPVSMPADVEARIFAALDAERQSGPVRLPQPGPVPVRSAAAPPAGSATVLSFEAARERRRSRVRTLSKVAAGLIVVVGLGGGIAALNHNGGTSNGSAGAGGGQAAAGNQDTVGGNNVPQVAPNLPSYDRSTLTRSSLLTDILNGKNGPLSVPGGNDRLSGCELGVAQQVPGAGANPAGVQHIRFEGTPAYLLAYTGNGKRMLVVVADTCTQGQPQVLFQETV